MTTQTSALTPGQRALLAHKIHVRPGALARSGGAVQEQLPSVWHGALQLVTLLAPMPEEALRWWSEQAAGHILLTAREEGYVPGALPVAETILAAVTLVPLAQVVAQPLEAAAKALLPLDHLLGCYGREGGIWLSDGGGIDARWQRIGAQVKQLFDLGYGLTAAACADPRVYLAEGIVAAMHNRRLNVADPKLARLLKSSILSVNFWRRSLQSPTM